MTAACVGAAASGSSRVSRSLHIACCVSVDSSSSHMRRDTAVVVAAAAAMAVVAVAAAKAAGVIAAAAALATAAVAIAVRICSSESSQGKSLCMPLMKLLLCFACVVCKYTALHTHRILSIDRCHLEHSSAEFNRRESRCTTSHTHLAAGNHLFSRYVCAHTSCDKSKQCGSHSKPGACCIDNTTAAQHHHYCCAAQACEKGASADDTACTLFADTTLNAA
eukprot:11136-Heterococcus_DN1.PRE.4